MATRKTVRRSAKGAAPRKMAPPSPLSRIPLRTIAVAVGVAGLTALAVALVGPRRVRDDYLQPLADATWTPVSRAVTPQAERAWAEIRPWRDRLESIFSSINTEEVRGILAERLSHWFERLRS